MRNTRSVKTYHQTFREDAAAFLERSKSPFAEVRWADLTPRARP